MYCNYPLTEIVSVVCCYMLQEPDGVHAKLLSIKCNIILGLFFEIIIKAFSSFFISWLKEKKISLKEVKEEAKKLKAFLICKKAQFVKIVKS